MSTFEFFSFLKGYLELIDIEFRSNNGQSIDDMKDYNIMKMYYPNVFVKECLNVQMKIFNLVTKLCIRNNTKF